MRAITGKDLLQTRKPYCSDSPWPRSELGRGMGDNQPKAGRLELWVKEAKLDRRKQPGLSAEGVPREQVVELFPDIIAKPILLDDCVSPCTDLRYVSAGSLENGESPRSRSNSATTAGGPPRMAGRSQARPPAGNRLSRS